MNLTSSQQVNRIGKYLYNNLDGAIKYNKSSNTFDVYVLILYQIPAIYQDPKNLNKEFNDVQEMTLDLSITTYQNKIRVDIIEVSPKEKTIGYDLYKPELLQDLNRAKQIILNRVRKRISKAYEDYDFLF